MVMRAIRGEFVADFEVKRGEEGVNVVALMLAATVVVVVVVALQLVVGVSVVMGFIV